MPLVKIYYKTMEIKNITYPIKQCRIKEISLIRDNIYLQLRLNALNLTLVLMNDNISAGK